MPEFAIARSVPESSGSALGAGSRWFESWRNNAHTRPRGVAEFQRPLDDVSAAPRSSHCANSDDAEYALEAGALVGALAQNLASAAGPGKLGLLAGRRPIS
ncbi:MAG: hypothetical protein ACLP8S_26210 [Solirubrobacteraceae bacterium]